MDDRTVVFVRNPREMQELLKDLEAKLQRLESFTVRCLPDSQVEVAELSTVTCFVCGIVVPETSAYVVDIDDDPDAAEHVCEGCFERGAYHKVEEK